MSSKRSRNTKPLRAVPARQSRVKKNKSQTAKNGYGGPLKTPNLGTLWYNSAIRGVPDAVRTRMRYVIPFQVVSNGASVVASLKFTSNAYDVDSALGSTAMAYFSELGTIYAKFRTLGMKYSFMVSTLETHGLAYVHGFSSISYSATGVGLNFAENPYLNMAVTGSVNANSQKDMSGEITVAKLFGTQQALVDDTFTGSTTSSTLPAGGTMYLYIGAVSTAVLAAGFDVTGFVELDLLFFDRNTLFS